MGADTRTGFGTLLRHFRLGAGLTQAVLAQRAGLSERAINDLERDPQRTPRLETVTLLAEALGLSPDDRAQLLAMARPDAASPRHSRLLGASSTPDHVSGPAQPDGVTHVRQSPVSPPSTAHAGMLPAAPSPFVGRVHEVAEVCARLREPEVRLLTLTGPGGIGKTRLALQVAAVVEEAYPDGVCFVALASLADPALVLPAVAVALGIPESAHQSHALRLAEALHAREVLLVLDNFEQVTSAAVEIGHLLTACPTLKILVTSRAVLHLAGEHEYPVPPLATPDSAYLPSPAELLTYDAIALFQQRARAVLPHFTLTEANAKTIIAICKRLEGVPLAIELAAARIKLLTPAALLARLDQQLAILTGGPRDAPARQRTVRATLDWSYELLKPEQQTLLRRLAVFAGGWTLEAAEGICAGEGVERADILDLLAHLVDQSLVLVGEQEGTARYRLLEPIHQYAAEKLRDAGEMDRLHDRHLAWFLQLAEDTESHAWIMPRPAAETILKPEVDNFRAALARSRRDASGQTELLLAGSLYALWAMTGTINEGHLLLRDALDRDTPASHTHARARALMAAANLAGIQTDTASAGLFAGEAIAIVQELGEERTLAQALIHVARARYWMGDTTAFAAARDESLRLCRKLGDLRAFAETLWFWADLALDQGDYATARGQLEECVAVLRQLSDPFMLAYPLISLARVACADGDVLRARTLAEEGLELRRAGAPAWLCAIALTSLGEVERCAGNDERASVLLAEALAIFREQDAGAGIAWSLHNLGQVALRAGDLQRAQALFAEALTARQRHRYAHGIATELAGMAGVRCLAADYGGAARLCGATEALLERSRTVLAPADLIAYERDVATLRSHMEEFALGAGWAAGRALPLEQAIGEALTLEGYVILKQV